MESQSDYQANDNIHPITLNLMAHVDTNNQGLREISRAPKIYMRKLAETLLNLENLFKFISANS